MRTSRKILVGALAALGLATAGAMTYADVPGALGQLAMGPGMGGSAGVMGPGMMGFGGKPRGGYGPGMMGPQGETRGYGPGMQGGQRGPGTGPHFGWGWNTPDRGRDRATD